MTDRSSVCRSCGSQRLQVFLDLGSTPLADTLVRADRESAPEPHYPLEVAFCPDCSLVQVADGVAAEELFHSDYAYFSSFSDALLRHSREHAENLMRARGLGPDSLVVELASNDGYLLRNFTEAGVPVLGIEPSPGPAAAARAAGVTTLQEFFGLPLAEKLRADGVLADVVIANNVMAHVPELNSFVAGISTLLAEDGLATIENPYVRDLIEHREFDTIYHEHYCYYSCTAVARLVERHGLWLNDVEYFPHLHGGTLRWHVGRHKEPTDRVLEYLAAEQRDGLTGFGYYADFAQQVETVKEQLLDLLRGLRAQGKTVAAYGAAAKGSTLLNYVGIDTDLVEFVVDRNVHKHGWLMPGMHQPVLAPEALLERQPDYALLLVWNFAAEVLAQQAEYRRRGGRFILPVPTPRISA